MSRFNARPATSVARWRAPRGRGRTPLPQGWRFYPGTFAPWDVRRRGRRRLDVRALRRRLAVHWHPVPQERDTAAYCYDHAPDDEAMREC
jgi:hypothetical protein